MPRRPYRIVLAVDTPTLLSSLFPSHSARTREGEQRSHRLSHRADAWALGVLLLTCIGIALLWMPFSIYRVDNLSFYYPWYAELGQSLRSLDIPGWLPTTMSGVPMAADPQSGWGYLPAMAIMTIAPSLTGYKLFIAFHIVFAAISSYLYARNLGLSPLGALTTGVAFTFGNFLERTSCCTIHMQVAVWIPAVFLCIDRGQRARDPVRRTGWLMLAGLGVSQIVSGWIGQGAYYGGLAVGFYLLYRFVIAPVREETLARRAGSVALAGLVIGVIGGAAAAPAILPRLDAISRSNLANLYEDGAGEQSNSGWSIALFAERIAGPLAREGRWYLGVALLSLAVMATILLGKNREVRFFAVYSLAILSLIIRDSPLTYPLNLLPKFESLHSHSPDRIYVVLFIGPAVLAGFLVDALASRAWKRPSTQRAIIAVALPVGLIVAALILVRAQDDSWLPPERVILTVAVCTIVGIALTTDSKRTAHACIALVTLAIFIDPTGQRAWDRLMHDRVRNLAESVIDGNTEPNGAARWLQDRQAEGEVFRYFGYDLSALSLRADHRTYVVGFHRPGTADLLVNNRSIRLGLDDIQGYNPVQIQRYVNYFEAINGQEQSYHAANVLHTGLNTPLLDMLNVRYIVIPADVPPSRPDLFHLIQRYPTVYQDDTNRILEKTDALPRYWVVHEAVTLRTGLILPTFASGEVDPRTTSLLDTKVPELEPLPAGESDSVEIIHRSADEIRLRVTVASDAMVILSEVWDPHWSATVDGRETRIYRANYLFRGIRVREGTHEVVLRFKAQTVKEALPLYLVPVAAFAALGIISLRASRPGQAARAEPLDAQRDVALPRNEPRGERTSPIDHPPPERG
jgi:hypothetical protein